MGSWGSLSRSQDPSQTRLLGIRPPGRLSPELSQTRGHSSTSSLIAEELRQILSVLSWGIHAHSMTSPCSSDGLILRPRPDAQHIAYHRLVKDWKEIDRRGISGTFDGRQEEVICIWAISSSERHTSWGPTCRIKDLPGSHESSD